MKMAENMSVVRTLVYNNKTIVFGGAEYNQIIAKLNYERVLFQLPVIVTISAVMLVGIFANIIVICVYRLTCKSSVASFFITLLAVVDLITALCIPFNIQDMLHPYLNAAPVVCKIGRFLESFMAVLSGNLLVCIAFDRYFHIIYPLKRYTFNQAQSLAIVMTAAALSISWPQLFLAGRKTVKIPNGSGMIGEDCTFRDGVYNSIYTLLYQGMLALGYFIGLSVFIIFYSRIYFVIWQKRNEIIGERVSAKSPQMKRCKKKKGRLYHIELKGEMSTCYQQSSVIMEELSMETGIEDQIATEGTQTGSHHDADSETQVSAEEYSGVSSQLTDNLSDIHSPQNQVQNKVTGHLNAGKRMNCGNHRFRTLRTTRIMATVTLAGVLSYTPYLLVNIFKNMGIFFKPDMGKTEDLVYEFCTKSHFINAFVNPLIYSIMNPNFRSDAWAIIKNVGKICYIRQRFFN